jgi:hypothetical protein
MKGNIKPTWRKQIHCASPGSYRSELDGIWQDRVTRRDRNPVDRVGKPSAEQLVREHIRRLRNADAGLDKFFDGLTPAQFNQIVWSMTAAGQSAMSRE